MGYQKIIKYAQVEEKINFVKGWKDSEGNVPVVVDISGKKYAFVKILTDNKWRYWLGIGSENITPEMPSGRGDYLIGSEIDQNLSHKISSIISSGVSLEPLSTSGVLWTPKDQTQKEKLAELINNCGLINKYLSQNGLLYTGTDRYIFGEDITGDIILGKSTTTTSPPVVVQTTSATPQVGTTQNTSSIPQSTTSSQPSTPQQTPTSSQSEQNKDKESSDGTRSKSPKEAKKVWTKEDLNKYTGRNINFNLMKDNKNNYRGALKPKYTELSSEYFESLKQFGIKRIISLNGDDEWGGANLPKLITDAGLQHVHNPIGSVPTRQEFDKIKEYLKMGNNLIHCTHGADRTGAVVGRYYVEELGWTPEQAIEDSIKYGGSKAIAKPEKYAGKGYEQYSDFITIEGKFATRKSFRTKVYDPK